MDNTTVLANEIEASELLAAEETTQAVTEVEHSIGFTPDAFLNSLPYMGKGMFGIFLVTALIISTVVVLNNITLPKKKKDKDKK